MTTPGEPLPQLSDHDIYQRLRRIPGPALVAITTPFCGACRHLRRALRELVAEDWPVPIFEVDANEGPGLIDELEIFHLPAMVLYVGGDYHRALRCPAEAEALKAAVARAAAEPPEEEP